MAIPAILKGQDIIGTANTGTGKTAAFLIPLLQKITMDRNQRVLIVAPTRELAVQIHKELRDFSRGLSIRSAMLIGGANEWRQRQDLKLDPHVVVATPGRLKDFTESRYIRLSTFRNVVLDEADRMVDMGDEAVENVRVGVESASPFAKSKSVTVSASQYPELATVEPGETGTIAIDFSLYASISQSATSTYENIPFTTRAVGIFDMDGTEGATTRDGELTYVMTSPVALDSFARYAAPSGDQIGRGPLPPYAGETTKYWVFWNLRGTTNELTNVRIEGELGANVTFTGRQTVSTNSGVTFDAASNEMVWTSDSVSPTFSPSSKIVGIALELALTPTDDQIGTVPTLLKNIRVAGTDAVTGAFVSASGATITTNLPNDAMAAGNATVE